jgi:hypothetical protein
LGFGVEGRVEVDEVDTLIRQMLAHDVEIIPEIKLPHDYPSPGPEAELSTYFQAMG